ncbi:MAG: hypothetical protein K1060chlam1_00496 [Candidatus Anoxychlamydiales bacterium]|nr:hypothetical protein [Candidatus Anoxychlamydiales bacterium]
MNCQRLFIFFIIFSLISCKDNKKTAHSTKIEKISRSKDDIYYKYQEPTKNLMDLYPFEEETAGFFKITKEFFRCKGNPLNPERVDTSNLDNVKVYLDCVGPIKHSLPLINGKEGVYPVLIDILNFVQRKTKKRVVITCGHRCPKHNSYADISNIAKTSKHLIGAEVDFYIQGLENSPLKVMDLIFDFYKEDSRYRGSEEYEGFQQYQKETDVSTPPWHNKEIFVKLYQYNEGRDFNNRHPYPYICIQVLYDRSTKQKVNYTWEKAYRGYLQH